MSVVVGVDLGTQSIKVVFYDSARRAIVGDASSPLNLYQGEDGIAEQQAHWWLDALRDAFQKVDIEVRRSARDTSQTMVSRGFIETFGFFGYTKVHRKSNRASLPGV